MADEQKKIGAGKGCLIVLGGIVGVSFLAAIVGSLDKNSARTSAGTDPQAALDKRAEQDEALLYRAQELVKSRLKDPDSAQFSDGVAGVRHGQKAACGYVNAKNSFGALAGASPWLIVPGKDIAMIKSYDNDGQFVRAWNTYCTGRDDRDKPIPAEMFGIKLGKHPPSQLKPFDSNKQVFVYAHSKPTEFLGVPLQDAYFEADKGRLIGGSATAKGGDAYDKWKAALLTNYGTPTSSGDGDRGTIEWKRGKKEPEAQLSYNSGTDQTLIQIGYPG